MKKTKSLVFNTTDRLENRIFSLNNLKIERCRNYKYLGVLFSINGSFREAKLDLCNRGLKAMFKFTKSIHGDPPKLTNAVSHL